MRKILLFLGTIALFGATAAGVFQSAEADKLAAVLQKARAGIYTAQNLKSVSAERRRRFFTRDAGPPQRAPRAGRNRRGSLRAFLPASSGAFHRGFAEAGRRRQVAGARGGRGAEGGRPQPLRSCRSAGRIAFGQGGLLTPCHGRA